MERKEVVVKSDLVNGEDPSCPTNPKKYFRLKYVQFGKKEEEFCVKDDGLCSHSNFSDIP